MTNTLKKLSNFKYFGFLVLFIGSLAFGLDKSKYIGVDEIKRGMDAYCLTVLAGTEPTKHPLKVVSVVYNQTPGRNAILVMGMDEAFKHIGAVQGCSGSPVYIDGRMAGALSAGWTFATDPLYAVTPIKYMLKAGILADNAAADVANGAATSTGIADFSKPIDLAAARDYVFSSIKASQSMAGGFTSLPCPLVTSFPGSVCQSLAGDFKDTGLMPLAGGGTSGGNDDDDEEVKYVPGGVLVIPLVSGDISMAAVGTVTEVVDDKVYGFGHSFLGQGAIDLPMASGKIHTVVSSMNISFKMGSAGKISGAFRADEETAIFGKTGEVAKLIPLRIKVKRFDAVEDRIYNCQMAYHRLYTPALLQSVVSGAVQMQGSLPNHHSVQYKGIIGIKGYDPIVLDNISSGRSLNDVLSEAIGTVSMLMNNPFGPVEIESFDFDISVTPDDLMVSTSSVQLDDTRVRAGDKVTATVITQSRLTEKTAYHIDIRIPKDLKPGKYKVIVGGSIEYSRFIKKVAPFRFMARDMDSLIKALRHVVNGRRDKLYMMLKLPSNGVTIEGNEIAGLPYSKTMLLKSPTRTLTTTPLGNWVEQSQTIPAILANGVSMEITVEKAL